MTADVRKILVLGASGLIGRFVTDDLRGRKSPRDPDHMKAACAEIVGDEAPDQAGRPEHENFARFAHGCTF